MADSLSINQNCYPLILHMWPNIEVVPTVHQVKELEIVDPHAIFNQILIKNIGEGINSLNQMHNLNSWWPESLIHITWGDRAIVLLAAKIAGFSNRAVAALGALFCKLWLHYWRLLCG